MSNRIVLTKKHSDTGYTFLKCKRCKNEFYVVWNSTHAKTVCYCPSCGQPRKDIQIKE